jgi:hypothetical protein
LTDALQSATDWTDVDTNDTGTDVATTGDGGDNATGGAGQETILSGGDVAEVGNNGTQKIPLSKAPPQLQKALASDVLAGMGGH